MAEKDVTIENIFKDLAMEKAKLYPVTKEELKKKSEYEKSLYFRMLCMLVQYGGTADEKQIWFLKRLIAGSGMESELNECMKMAMDIEKEDIEAFLTVYRNDVCKLYFLLDALILINLTEMNDKQCDASADLAELLSVTAKELETLSLLAKSVLLQDPDIFDTAEECAVDSIRNMDLISYVNTFYTGDISLSINGYHYFSCGVKLEKSINSKENVIFENCTVEINMGFKLNNCANVEFINCILKGNIMYIIGSGNVSFIRCAFKNFDKSCVKMENISNLNIENCRFENCICYGDNGIIYISDIKDISIKNNIVTNCKGMKEYCFGLFLRGHGRYDRVYIENNTFNNCYSLDGTGFIFYFEKVNKLSQNNNIIDNCRKILLCNRQ